MSGALSISTASRWKRTVSIRASSETSGATWTRPCFTVHGPKPSASHRSATSMVRSWCQPSAQFAPSCLSNRMARTSRISSPNRAAVAVRRRLTPARSPARAESIRCPGHPLGQFTKSAANSARSSSSRREGQSAQPRSSSSAIIRSARRSTSAAWKTRPAHCQPYGSNPPTGCRTSPAGTAPARWRSTCRARVASPRRVPD
ncbi:Uncharacterised protein [Sphingomonas paucimobilis]|nr:Uncharacterised protein [Sphingomonas paucimobilis]